LPYAILQKGSIFQLSDVASGSTNAVRLGRAYLYLFGLTNGNRDKFRENLSENNHLAMLVMQKLQTSVLKVMMP